MFNHGRDTRFTTSGYTVDVSLGDVVKVITVLGDMSKWIEDLIIAIDDDREAIPGTDEEASLLLAAIELLRRRGESSPALNRLHYVIRQRSRPDSD